MIIKTFKTGTDTIYNATPDQLVEMGFDQASISAAINEQAAGEAAALRRAAYTVESDPLYMEWQYDQTPEAEQAWRDKVAEIKARYPLPTE